MDRLILISVTLFCFTYVFSQGSRWDWFEEPHIVWLTVIGTAALLAFLVQQVILQGPGPARLYLFKSDDFCFAFAVSFVAGAALFGSAFLIPSFAVSVLAFTPTDAGSLLLPSGALFIAALLIAGFLFQVRRVPPIATVPFGILMIMASMWMLSGSTSESGADDMMAAILLRGLGLGFLFLSLTLMAFTHLDSENLASGIGIFNTGRQLGGLMGVAWLQTLIEHNVTGNLAVLAAHVPQAFLPSANGLRRRPPCSLQKAWTPGRQAGCYGPPGQGRHRAVYRDRFRHGIQCSRAALSSSLRRCWSPSRSACTDSRSHTLRNRRGQSCCSPGRESNRRPRRCRFRPSALRRPTTATIYPLRDAQLAVLCPLHASHWVSGHPDRWGE